MNSSTVLTFLVCLCILAAVIEAKYQAFTKQQLIDWFPLHDANFQEHAVINSEYRDDCNTSIIPPDDGSSSFGDLIYSEPRNLDKVLLNEIFLNYNVSSDEHIVFWKKRFYKKCVSHVKVLNFGRERAFAKSISISHEKYDGDTVDIIVLIPANKEVRMIFEAFGYDMYAPKYCD